MTAGWLPRTPVEGLVRVDGLLADIVPRAPSARAALVDVLPGHSGRPAGTGEPPGGSGGHGSTVVERTVLAGDQAVDELARFDGLVTRTVDLADLVVDRALAGSLRTHPPQVGSMGRRLSWAAWAIRVVLDLHHAAPDRVRIPPQATRRLHDSTAALEQLVDRWTTTPTRPARRSSEMAVDRTESWCVSCLRTGRRVPRSERYVSAKMCRSCGDFTGVHGFEPTLDIVDALADGRYRDVERLVRDEKARRNKSRRRKRRS